MEKRKSDRCFLWFLNEYARYVEGGVGRRVRCAWRQGKEMVRNEQGMRRSGGRRQGRKQREKEVIRDKGERCSERKQSWKFQKGERYE